MFGVKIGQCHHVITSLTPLRLGEIVPVFDLTVGVVVAGTVERCERRVFDMRSRIAAVGDVRHVVDDRVHHEEHAPLMHFCTQVQQILFRAEMRVEAVDVFGPISMVGFAVTHPALYVLHDGRDHDRVEPHPLDVI